MRIHAGDREDSEVHVATWKIAWAMRRGRIAEDDGVTSRPAGRVISDDAAKVAFGTVEAVITVGASEAVVRRVLALTDHITEHAGAAVAAARLARAGAARDGLRARCAEGGASVGDTDPGFIDAWMKCEVSTRVTGTQGRAGIRRPRV